MTLAQVEPWIQAVTKRNDATLAVLVVMIVAMIVLPMPTVIVDTLIAVNIAVAVVLVMLSIYIPSPVSFSSFPSVLLFSTLFRLALSITTTRLILLHANAGDIIHTFGIFVVGGNIVVGLVIFFIITIVQFIVVTKGAERVAEVTARFSLDGLPGKQMSIDGDMRAGVIDMDEARRRRRTLEKESQLYGSLDGAMKFVKGDAIAGIFIIIINIIGGISIGAMQHNMSVGEAGSVYTVLTVGDGLVTQIPALLISITAGIMVTRVTSADAGTNLGTEIGRQMLAYPKALLIAAALLFGFALVPGFPVWVFVGLGLVLGLVGLTLQAAAKREEEGEGAFLNAMSGAQARQQQDRSEPGVRSLGHVSPLTVTLHASLQPGLDHYVLDEELARVRKRLYNDLGVPTPGVHLRYNSDVGENEYRISVHEVPVGNGTVRPGYLMVLQDADTLRRDGMTVVDSGRIGETPYAWVSETTRDNLNRAGLGFLTNAQLLARHLAVVLERHASELVGIQETKQLLDGLIPEAADLAKEATNAIPLPVLSETLRRLLSEGVPIRNFVIIVETLLKFIAESKEPAFLSEHCRRALSRQISYRFSNEGVLAVVVLEPDAEQAAMALQQGEADVDTRRQLMAGIVDAITNAAEQTPTPVLLVRGELRQPLREHVRHELAMTPVLSFEDLSNEVQVEPFGRVTLTSEEEAMTEDLED